jgi:hypothetical protein
MNGNEQQQRAGVSRRKMDTRRSTTPAGARRSIERGRLVGWMLEMREDEMLSSPEQE